MSRAQKSAGTATLEAPPPPAAADPPAEMQIVINRPSDVVYRGRLLRDGVVQVLPRELALELIAEGRAHSIVRNRYVATSTTFFGSHTVERGGTLELTGGTAPATDKGESHHGVLIPLGPDQAVPDPLPPDPADERHWRRGPLLRVRVLEARVGLVRGHLTLKAGDVVEMREDAAVHATFHKLVEPIDPFTTAGRETLALYSRSVFTPSYEKVAARHRQKAAPPAPGSLVRVRMKISTDFMGQKRTKGEELTVDPAAAVAAEMQGIVEIKGAKTTRMQQFESRLRAHQRSPQHTPFPTY